MKTQNKNIIACIDIKNGTAVKGVNFTGLKEVGNPVEMALQYANNGADEIALLNIAATDKNTLLFLDIIKEVSKNINVPILAGGGINTLQTANNMLLAGATKISIGSAAVKSPTIISQLSQEFGSDKIVVAIDYKTTDVGNYVYIKGGKEKTNILLNDFVKKAESLGAGEILLTSMNKDGTKSCFDLKTISEIVKIVGINIIASGGAGEIRHFTELFTKTDAKSALAAGIFHSGVISIAQLKQELQRIENQ